MAVYTTIDDPSAYFKVQLYTGNGSTNAITFDDTDTNMQPDWVWLKNRNSSGHDHFLFNAVNGVQRFLSTNDTGALASADSSYLTAFNSDGFTLGSSDGMNENSITFCSWNWKANGAGSSNSDGSITSTVSANTTSGFSIVTWTGNSGSIGHGLGVKPAMIIAKSTGATGGWYVTQQSLSAEMQDNYMFLNTGSANTTNNNIWGGEPTTSTFSVGSGLIGDTTHVAYVFADVQGFSKFGSYVGNGNTNGTFVYTGFRPAMIISKKTSGTSDWIIWDNKRDGYNETLKRVYPNDPANEESSATQGVDFLSNGFKLRGTNSNAWNASGGSYIYMAFAESPFVNSNGVPNNAI